MITAKLSWVLRVRPVFMFRY